MSRNNEMSLDFIKEQKELKRVTILDNMAVRREAIGVFTKIINRFPDLTDEASELIFIEQSNITKDMSELVDAIRGYHEEQ